MASRKLLPPQVQVPLVRGKPVTRFNSSIDDDDTRLPLSQTHYRDPSRSSYSSSTTSSLHVLTLSVLEDRIASQDLKIQSLLHDNQRMAASHVALKKDLAAAEKQVRQLSAAAEEIEAQRDAEVREVYEDSLKLNAEVRVIDEMSAELVQVRGDAQKLTAINRDLALELQAIENDLVRARADSQQVSLIASDIEVLRCEIERGRVAIEYETKTRDSNIQHSKAMDKNMVTMVAEIDKLRLELENAEKRARIAAAIAVAANLGPGYPSSYGNPEFDFYSRHQVQSVDANTPFVSGAMLHHTHDCT